MKNKIVICGIVGIFLVSALTGCGSRNRTETEQDNQSASTVSTESAGDFSEDFSENITMDDTQSMDTTDQLGLGNAVEIPEGWDGQLAETESDQRIERIIAEYCNIEEPAESRTPYYYNYVDLDGDSRDEILALVLGEEQKLLWIAAETENGEEAVRKEFRNIEAPVYISHHMTEGYRDLIMQRAGELGYVRVVWKGDGYQDVSEGEILQDLNGYEGTAVLTNNMQTDLANENYHFLGEAEDGRPVVD